MINISKIQIKLVKEVELNSDFKEISDEKISAYIEADNGMRSWICSCNNRDELLEFLNPETIVDSLSEVLSQEEMNVFFEALQRIPYNFGSKKYKAVFL